MKNTLLALSQIEFSYSPASKPQLKVDDFKIHAGETVALVGRNGSGKSTLLLTLSGLLEPQKGQRVANIPREKIALVFQTPCLDKKLTVGENLTLFGKVWGMKRSQIDTALDQLNPTLQLDELLPKVVQTLSGGQQRRADLARALLSDPAVLFLDEPTVGLDLVAQREFWNILSETGKIASNRTIICASHHAAELKLFQRLVFMNDGKIALDAEQKTITERLPSETLEVNTIDQAEDFVRGMLNTAQLAVSVPSRDKVLIHSDNATALLEQIKADKSLNAQVESVLVRKTQLSDALWHELIRLSDSSLNAPATGAYSS
jgi:ABC-2 type transport system ATP-binding protein